MGRLVRKLFGNPGKQCWCLGPESRGGDETCIGSQYILKVEPAGFAERLDMDYEKKGGNGQE